MKNQKIVFEKPKDNKNKMRMTGIAQANITRFYEYFGDIFHLKSCVFACIILSIIFISIILVS